MTIFDHLKFILGLKSWNIVTTNYFDKIITMKNKEYIVDSLPIKNKLKLLHFFETTASPERETNSDYIRIEYSSKYKILIYLYNIYSFFVFCICSAESSYLLYKMINSINLNSSNFNLNNTNSSLSNSFSSSTQSFQNYFIHFLINLNAPITYIWAKNYFKTNHFTSFIKDDCKQVTKLFIIIIISSLVSIIINFYNTNFFYNDYYYINYFDQKIAYILIIIEWFYTRLLYSIGISTFTLIFCNHLKEINNFIEDITDYKSLEDAYCLSNYIANVSYLRHTVEISCNFYNWIMSFVSITGTLSIALYIRFLYNEYIQYKKFEFEDREYYLLQCYFIYAILQVIFFYIVIKYSYCRNLAKKEIQDAKFINKFLTRFSLSKIKNKCRDSEEIKYISKLILCLEEENASTIDWLILEKLLNDRWIDFSIAGISIHDGSLIKKIVALSGIVLFIMGII